MSEPHYVVLIGDVGTGKSTIVEKLCDVQDRSSDSSVSFTRESKLFHTTNRRLIISDTPGTNAMTDKVAHNTQVAVALNYMPVSRILIVVKADTRIDNVVDDVRKYAEQFMDLDMGVIGVLVTHMDTVQWDKENLVRSLDAELGVNSAVFSARETSVNQLEGDILGSCQRRYPLSIDSESFFKLFKINNSNMRILRTCKKQVDLFKAIKERFGQERMSHPQEQQADLAFEFQAFMTEQILTVQKKVAEENNFTFSGESAINEAGHVANMTNQLRAILYDIRMETMGYAKNTDINGFVRKCPHCGEVWCLVEGCEGLTNCGADGFAVTEAANNGVMASFTFRLRTGNELESFTIEKGQDRTVKDVNTKPGEKRAGCGREITWTAMAPVTLPPEVAEAVVAINTEDINVVPAAAVNVKKMVGNMLLEGAQRLGFGN